MLMRASGAALLAFAVASMLSCGDDDGSKGVGTGN